MDASPELCRMPLAHFHRTASDLKASVDFYVRTVGFFYDHGVRDAAWLTLPGLLLTLAAGEPKPEGSSYFGFALASEAELAARYEWLYSRRQRLSGPPEPGAPLPHFFLYDPDEYPMIYSCARLDYPLKVEAL